MADQTKKIRELNDQFRKGEPGILGQVLITSGVQELADQSDGNGLAEVIERVRSFEDFSEDNDPHHEHDFGAFEFLDNKLFWKIDYYAPDMLHGSEDPADVAKTVRVLTLMLASEY